MEIYNKLDTPASKEFEQLKYEFPDVVQELRGKGLLCGMKLKKSALEVRKMMLEKFMLGGSAGDNVLRLAPPLIINETHVNEAVAILRSCFEEAKKLNDFEV